jgi:hypothetical protein
MMSDVKLRDIMLCIVMIKVVCHFGECRYTDCRGTTSQRGTIFLIIRMTSRVHQGPML